MLGLEASWMLKLASSYPQRLLTLPLEVIVVRHQVNVCHWDVVILRDWAGGKPGEASDRQLWLGRDGSKLGPSLSGAGGCSLRLLEHSPSCIPIGRGEAGQQCLQPGGDQSQGKAPWT